MDNVGNMLKTAMALLLAVSCSSCGWFGGEIKDEEVAELEKDMRVDRRETMFTPALHEMGRLLQAYNVPKTPIQSKNIGNDTAEKDVPSDLYTMVAASIGKIGPQVIFIPFDAQYVISETTTGGTIKRMYPQVVITGGITGFDKEMFQKERETEVSGGWAGAQGGVKLKASGETGRLTVDFNMLDYRSQSAFPGVVTSNSILLTKDSFGWGVYAYYMGNGGSFDYSLKHKQGVHAALRNLVEYSVLELVGKYAKVPYWRCLQGANPDTDMIAMIKDQFQAEQKEPQMLKLKNLLFLHGFNGLNRNSPEFTGAEDSALKEAMRRQGTSDLAELYIKLWLDVPLESAARRVTIARRQELAEQRRLDEERQKAAAAEGAVAAKRQQEQQREHEAKVKLYNGYVTTGDQLYNAGKMEAAEAQYRAANGLFGGETYPRQMIAKIVAAKQQQEQQAEAFRQQLATADRLYAAAEKESFRYTAYKATLDAYRQALQMRPGDVRISERIARIKAVLNKYSPVTVKGNGEEW